MPGLRTMVFRNYLVWGALLFMLAACGPASPPPLPTATLERTALPGQWYVEADTPLGAINPLVYGANHGPWAVITDKTLPLAQEAGITILRFPGGNWGDENTLTTNHIDQFVALANQMGAQVSISVRLFNGTPEKAAELVRYANLEKGYGIHYWSIGNEPTLYATARSAPDYGVKRFNQEWRAFAQAMKAVDTSIALIGPELHQYGPDLPSTPKDPLGLDWMTEFLKANGDLVDVVSIHRYPFPAGRGGQAASLAELRASAAEWDAIIPYLRELIQETTGRDIPIAVTEVNSHWSNAVGGEASPDSFYNAIWWADVLGRLIRQGVGMVNYFSLQSHPSIGGYGLFARSETRPTYYVYRLYRMFGTQLVYSSSNQASVGVYAARRADGCLTILLVNLGDEEARQPLVVRGFDAAQAEIWRFDSSHLAELVGEETFTSGAAFSLPPQSITLLIVR